VKYYREIFGKERGDSLHLQVKLLNLAYTCTCSIVCIVYTCYIVIKWHKAFNLSLISRVLPIKELFKEKNFRLSRLQIGPADPEAQLPGGIPASPEGTRGGGVWEGVFRGPPLEEV
jgi:hypothetical protein